MSQDWSRMSNPEAARSLGAYSTLQQYAVTSFSTLHCLSVAHDAYRNVGPRQCGGCGAWKQEERHGRQVCAYCGNPK